MDFLGLRNLDIVDEVLKDINKTWDDVDINTLDLDDKEAKIKQLNAEIKSLKQQDLGFKIFETTPIWEDYDFESTELDNQTKLFDESKLNTGAGSGLDEVEHEDEEVVENVQKGIRSRFYTHGRYAPNREQGTHHFHSLIAEFIR